MAGRSLIRILLVFSSTYTSKSDFLEDVVVGLEYLSFGLILTDLLKFSNNLLFIATSS
jgi:hypothetical protein